MQALKPFRFTASTLVGAVTALLLAGCATWRPLAVPLRTIELPATCAKAPDTLLVMLPGAYSPPEEFVQEGLVQTVRERQLAADLLLVDTQVGYYSKGAITERLRDDVIRPARARGYRHIWIVGISLGGVGAMIAAEAQPDDIDGIVLLAPYLGSRLSALEIRNAGGLQAWRAPPVPPEGDADLHLWRWLQAQTSRSSPGKKVPLFLGYGLSDRFVYNHEVLSQALPASQVVTTEGGHDWPVWRPLWRRLADMIPVARDSSCR